MLLATSDSDLIHQQATIFCGLEEQFGLKTQSKQEHLRRKIGNSESSLGVAMKLHAPSGVFSLTMTLCQKRELWSTCYGLSYS